MGGGNQWGQNISSAGTFPNTGMASSNPNNLFAPSADIFNQQPSNQPYGYSMGGNMGQNTNAPGAAGYNQNQFPSYNQKSQGGGKSLFD